MGTTRTYTPRASRSNYGKQRTVICYNCKGEGHMSKHCTKPKRKHDDSWFKDKVLLVQAQANGQILHEEELAFLADPGNYRSANDTLTAELERYKEQVKVLKEGQNVDLKSKDNISDSCEQSVEIDRLKQTLSEHLKEKESLMQTVTLLKNDFKKEESRNIDREISLEKKIKQLDNIVYKRDQSAQTVPQSQEKDMVIKKLKERIKSLSRNVNEDMVKNDIEEIETINIELDHKVSKLIAENEHLKQTYKQLYDSIKPTQIRSKEQCDALVVQIILWYLDSGCSKHMTEDRSQLTNFVNKFLGTVKFGNDHVAKILGYGDYQIGNVMISRVTTWRLDKLISPLGKKKPHKPKSEDTNQEKLYLMHMDLCGLMHVRSVNGKKYILVIVDDYSRFTWVKCLRSKDEAPEAVATACYTQNRSIIRLRHDKTPYDLLHDKLPDLSFFLRNSVHFCDLTNIVKLDFDELTAMASEHNSLEPALYEMTPATISLGLVPNPPPSTPFVPPSRTNWDLLFQPFVATPETRCNQPIHFPTTVDQDTPSPSNSQTTPETQSSVIPNDVEKDNHDLDVAC
ncbi:retrovirus-related pol polyprotein from transposon TNT 1-94 [Tanacetum coccineum]